MKRRTEMDKIMVGEAIPIREPAELDSNGLNTALKFNTENPDALRICGFQRSDTYHMWILYKAVSDSIGINIRLYDDGRKEVDVLDEDFCQPYDFQYPIMNDINNVPYMAKKTQAVLYKILSCMKENGVLEGWSVGDYV